MASISNRASAQLGSITQLDGVAGMVKSTNAPIPSATFGNAPTATSIVPALTGSTTTVAGTGSYVASASSATTPAWRAFENVSPITWTSRTAAANSTWRSVAWSPQLGIFCAVSSSGLVMTSPDGATWTSRTAASATASWWSVAWSPALTLFVAVAFSGEIMSSSNGTDWTLRTAPNAVSWMSVTWSPEKTLFVAVAWSGAREQQVMISSNGIDWFARTSAEATTWRSVVWAAEIGLFVAVSESGTKRVMTSPDGSTWTGITVPLAAWYWVGYSPKLTLLCAVDLTGTIMTSSNGVTWTSRAVPGGDWGTVCWAPEIDSFYAVSTTGGAIATSSDGMQWRVTSGVGGRCICWSTELGSLCVVGGATVGIGRYESWQPSPKYTGLSSYDPTSSWTAQTAASATTWTSVAWSGDLSLFVAVADSGAIMSSPDGATWTSRTAPAVAWNGVCWGSGPGLFVAVASSGTQRFATSPDGINWTARDAPAALSWMSVTWSPERNLYVAVAQNGTANQQIATSPNGTNWTSRTAPHAVGWWSVCWSSARGLFVAVAYAGGTADQRIATSPDGVTWSARTAPYAVQWLGVCYSETLDLFVAVANSGTASQQIMSSRDGITWTARTAPNAVKWRSVTWVADSGLFVAVAFDGVASQQIMVSPDGITWSARTAAIAANWNSVCYAPELTRLCAVAYGGTSNRVMTTTLDTRRITGAYDCTRSWVSRTSPAVKALNSVCWSAERRLFVAVSTTTTNTQQIMTSPDGRTWSIQNSPNAVAWRSVTWSPQLGLFCAVASSGTPAQQIMTSPDGVTWTPRTAPSVATPVEWSSVCWAPGVGGGAGLFCAVATTGMADQQIMTSPDGENWSPQTAPIAGVWRSVCYSPEKQRFVALASNGNVMSSSDGITWIQRGSTEGDTMVIWAAGLGLFVAIRNPQGNYQYSTSPDGETWTSRTGLNGYPSWYCITWAEELGVIVALNHIFSNLVAVSRDGITWSFGRVPTTAQHTWRSVCWSPELRTLCAVASNGTAATQIVTTTVESTVADGITYDGEWLQVRLPNAVAPTSYTMAVQSGSRMPKSFAVLGSTDGSSWKLLDRKTNVSSFTNQTQRTFTIQRPQKVETIRVVIDKVQGGYAYTDVPDLRYVAFEDHGVPLNITSQGLRVPGNVNVHTKQAWDGDWSSLGGHILPMLQKARDSCSIMPGLDTVRLGPTGITDSSGAVLMADGRVYIVPGSGTTARIFDPSNGVISTPGGTFAAGANKFIGAVLLQDGRVFCTPQQATYATIYDPISDSISSSTATFPGGTAGILGAVLLHDGRVLCVPGRQSYALLYDVATDTNTTTAAIFPYPTVTDPFIGCVLLPNGQVFCVPWNSQRAYIFDPVTLTATPTTASFTGGYIGGTLLPDGNVYCFPVGSTTARIYDYRTGVVRSPNVTFPGGGAFAGGCLLPCGRVLLRPNNSTTARVHDVVTDTVSTPTGAALVQSSETLLLPDGRIVAIPSGNNAIRYIHTGGWGSYRLPMNVLTSPYMNTKK